MKQKFRVPACQGVPEGQGEGWKAIVGVDMLSGGIDD